MTGMKRLSRLSEGSTIKKRTTMWPDGTKQVDEDLAWDDDGKAKKESAGMPRLSRLVEEKGPRHYLTVATGQAQQGGGHGRVWGVVDQGQSLMATTLDKSKALALYKYYWGDELPALWDGDKGEFGILR